LLAGHTFIAPLGWSVIVKGKATIVEAPEGGNRTLVFRDARHEYTFDEK
jgi:hypothetical protein